MKILLFILAGLVAVTTTVRGQSDMKHRDRREDMKAIDSSVYEAFKASYPITRDALNQFADSLSIHGRLVDVTMGVSCGYFCGCGTMKIKVTKRNASYKHDYLYVAFACFNFLPKELKERRQWDVYKLPVDDTRCYWTEVPMNKFDKRGLPFYTVREHRKRK